MELRHLVSRAYEVVEPYAGTESVKDKLLKHSFLVVKETGRFMGLLTPKDVIASTCRLVVDCLREKPRLYSNQSVESAMRVMEKEDHSVLPVYEAENFIGVVTHSVLTSFFEDYRKKLETEINRYTFDLRVAHDALKKELDECKGSDQALQEARTAIEKQNEKLEKMGKLKDDVIYDVTHELKTPIAKHSMQLQVLEKVIKQYDLIGEVQSIIDGMRASLKRQESVINNIMNLAGFEVRGKSFRMTKLRIDRILRDVIKEYRDFVARCNIVVNSDLEAVTSKSNREMLQRVFSNIIGNAVKYRKKNVRGKLDISCRKEGEIILVNISDNGIGLSKKEIQRVFDRFYQVSPSTEGIGVGLTVSRLIMEHLGGKMRLESSGKGKGTTVIVEMPSAV